MPSNNICPWCELENKECSCNIVNRVANVFRKQDWEGVTVTYRHPRTWSRAYLTKRGAFSVDISEFQQDNLRISVTLANIYRSITTTTATPLFEILDQLSTPIAELEAASLALKTNLKTFKKVLGTKNKSCVVDGLGFQYGRDGSITISRCDIDKFETICKSLGIGE